jgi:hypothetical protein
MDANGEWRMANREAPEDPFAIGYSRFAKAGG